MINITLVETQTKNDSTVLFTFILEAGESLLGMEYRIEDKIFKTSSTLIVMNQSRGLIKQTDQW